MLAEGLKQKKKENLRSETSEFDSSEPISVEMVASGNDNGILVSF